MSESKLPAKKKQGRPPTALTPGVFARLALVPEPGTLTQITETLGVSTTVFYRWMDESEDFRKTVNALRAKADDQVEKALFDRALGYTEPVTKAFVDKDGGEHQIEQDMHVPPDVKAINMWLMNRRPADWRNRVEVEVKGDHVARVEELAKVLNLSPGDYSWMEEPKDETG